MKKRALFVLCFALLFVGFSGYCTAEDSFNVLTPEYAPPAAKGIFADVPASYWASGWIEQLYLDGITTGCSANPLSYCPDSYVTRAEMAAFLLRLRYGGNPPAEAASMTLVGNWTGSGQGIFPNAVVTPELPISANVVSQTGSLFVGTFDAAGTQAIATGNVSADKSIHATISVQVDEQTQTVGVIDGKWESEDQISGVLRDFNDGSTSYFTMNRVLE
ncbi:MAG: hypothetical protein WCA08_13470 [Desulfoferrobacter sp.]